MVVYFFKKEKRKKTKFIQLFCIDTPTQSQRKPKICQKCNTNNAAAKVTLSTGDAVKVCKACLEDIQRAVQEGRDVIIPGVTAPANPPPREEEDAPPPAPESEDEVR